MNNLELFNIYIEKIKESGIPVEYLTSLDIKGNFIIEVPQTSEDTCKYTGKVISNGVIAICESENWWHSDMDCYDGTHIDSLIVHNIKGYDFKAKIKTTTSSLNYKEKLEQNKAKIVNLFENYNLIINELDSGIDDDYLKEKFNLDFFESCDEYSKQKEK